MSANQLFNNSATKMQEEDFFHIIVDNNINTICVVLFSTLIWALSLPLLTSIIWYERNGFEQYNLFTNKLLTLICWMFIRWFFFLHTSHVYRFTFGPLPKLACFWQQLMHRTFLKQGVLFIDGMMVSRYAFIFWLKNPAAFQADFWIIFFNLWVNCFVFFSQFAVDMLLGSDSLDYQFCTGKDPTQAFKLPKYFLGHTELVSIILFPILQLKIYLYKNKKSVLPETHSIHQRSLQIVSIEKSSLGNFLTDFQLALFASFNAIIYFIANQTQWQEHIKYPNYILFYYKFLLAPCFISFMLPFFYIFKHKKLQKTLLRQIREKIFGGNFYPLSGN